MRLLSSKLRLSATDLSNHLACRHLTTLDLEVARHTRPAPPILAPDLKIIQELGLRHEAAYLEHLTKQGLVVENLSQIKDESRALTETLALMERGAQVIAQGALRHGDWFGRPDILRRVETPSQKWSWAYQVADTKLARETKATTILQLALYSELLEKTQGTRPELFWVIPPGNNFDGEQYPVLEYAAYYRYVRDRLLNVINKSPEKTYPEPVQHCEICRWFKECDQQRRHDDHLSLVAGIRRHHRAQFEEWGVETMAKLAELPTPLQQKPGHGAKASYERVREQARLQVQARTKNRLVYEPILPVTEGMGFCRLPEPSTGDMFVDLEGDPFVGDHGFQYLFGFAYRNSRKELFYEKRWALNREEEKKCFEWLVDEILCRREANPGMHVYHFGAYEETKLNAYQATALKNLMGTYATREEEIDRLLRAGTLVDLHMTFKQALIAGVESYSLKKLEAFCGFQRKTSLDASRAAMRYIEHRLELGWRDEALPENMRESMEGYNAEDCFATEALRDWLERERKKLVDGGLTVPRFLDRDEKPSEDVEEQQTRVAELVPQLTKDIPAEPKERTAEQQAQWLLAQLLDWHRRDAKPKAWRYFDLRAMDDSDLMDEKDAIAGLEWQGTVNLEGVVVDRYSFPKQETNVRADDKKEAHYKEQKIGKVLGMDPIKRTVDIQRTGSATGFHPPSIFIKEPYRQTKAQQDSLYGLGCWVRDHGIAADGPSLGVRNFMLRKPPQFLNGEGLKVSDVEEFSDELALIVSELDRSVLAVQGPPGSGKTTSAAEVIIALVTKRGLRVGVSALSHSVIRNLLNAIVERSDSVRCMHKSDGKEKEEDRIEQIQVTTDNKIALKALKNRSIDVLGGTAYLWARKEFANSVDILFVDEASQVPLADVVAISPAAENMVLIGDPQQLARPGDAAHPPGAELSCLEHILIHPQLGRLKTIHKSLGLFIEKTKRLHPNICNFTSTAFYEGRLLAHNLTSPRVLQGHSCIQGAGLWFVPVEHHGNRNSSAEEIEVIVRIVESLLLPKVKWVYVAGRSHSLKEEENKGKDKGILILAPYNAQVSDLGTRLPGISVGTVDKFQGQGAAVVIYSLTTSSPEDAPRGMEFLYSLNRFNVATSRAKSAVIVVGNPRLFEPECRTPRQMLLANAMCAFREIAKEVKPEEF